MKKQMFTVAAALLLSTFAPQSQAAPVTQAKIPFAFEVNNKTMPAGEYELARVFESSSAPQVIRSTDSSTGSILPTMVLQYTDRTVGPKLVFHCYGRECFLSEVWSGDGRAWKLPESRREKEMTQISADDEDLASIAVPLSVKH
jgi:hypothetical protein